LTKKIEDMLRRLKAIEGQDLSYERRKADEKVPSSVRTGVDVGRSYNGRVLVI